MNPTIVSDFCKTALKRLLVSNDTPSPKISPAQLNDALNELNLISDSWNTDGKMIYTQQFYTFALVAGQQTYTIGPSNTANFNTGTQPRPSYLETASFRLSYAADNSEFNPANGSVAITSDQFTATANQTVFELSVTPTNQDYVIVSRNGLIETPDMYSLEGNVLTLSSPANANDIVEVREFSAAGVITTGSTGTVGAPLMDLPMRIVDASEWASIVSKNITSSIGFYIYMDGAWPLGNINIWPIPNQAAGLYLTTWSSLGSAMGLSDTISLPPGYARGLSLDLSLAMAPYYGKSGDPSVQQMAGTLNKIKKEIGWVNIRNGQLLYSGDAQGAGGSGGVYDILSDRNL